MRRAVARGRVFPQSYSTDRRYGRLSLKACALFPLMWTNADDQGRLPGDPEEIKYACCPNIDHITKADIPELLEELDRNQLIRGYDTPNAQAIQILDWWDIHRPQWAWPSDYPPPDGWKDRLRYKRGAKEVVKENWFSQVSENNASGEQHTATQVSENSASGEQHTATQVSDKMGSGEQLGTEIRSILIDLPEPIDRLAEHEAVKDTLAKIGRSKGFIPRSEVMTTAGRVDLTWELSGQVIAAFEIDPFWPRKRSLTKLKNLDCKYRFVILRSNEEPLQWLEGILLIGLAKERESSKEREIENEKERGKRKPKEEIHLRAKTLSGEKSTPSPRVPPSEIEILHRLTECFKREWGRVPAESPEKVILREPGARESAQLRDLARELSSAGGCPLDYIDQAFRDVAGRPGKMHISYVRIVLLHWLHPERGPP